MNDSDSQLIDAYLDGNLTSEQGEALQQMLRNDPEARATLRRRATIDEGLTDLAAAASIANRSSDFVAVESDTKVTATGGLGSRIPLFIPWTVACALALVLSFTWFSSTDPIPETDPKADSALGTDRRRGGRGV